MLARAVRGPWLGTDAFGRDVLSRNPLRPRTAMLVGFASVSSGPPSARSSGHQRLLRGQGGPPHPASHGYLLAFPLIILALAVVSILAPGS